MTNAVLMAAGLGMRMKPLTDTIPKPLIKVNNKPMIETIIDALENANINKIHIVVGYLAEQFEYLTKKYSNITLVKNPDYKKANNISSIYYAIDKVSEDDCFICEADLYISDIDIFKGNFLQSCYFGKFKKGYSDDWVFDTDKNGYISRVGKIGNNRFNMVGISYFTKKDANILTNIIENAYNQPEYINLFWDDIVNYNLDKLKLKVYEIQENQIVEIDTVQELEVVKKGLK